MYYSYSPCLKGKFEGESKGEKNVISKTVEATPAKIGCHTFHINLYLHEFFELILFYDPHGLYPWSERKFGRYEKRGQNL